MSVKVQRAQYTKMYTIHIIPCESFHGFYLGLQLLLSSPKFHSECLFVGRKALRVEWTKDAVVIHF